MIRGVDAVLVCVREVPVQQVVEGIGSHGMEQTSKARLVGSHHDHLHPLHPLHPFDGLARLSTP